MYDTIYRTKMNSILSHTEVINKDANQHKTNETKTKTKTDLKRKQSKNDKENKRKKESKIKKKVVLKKTVVKKVRKHDENRKYYHLTVRKNE